MTRAVAERSGVPFVLRFCRGNSEKLVEVEGAKSVANLLLIDDDHDLLKLCRKVLAAANHNVWSADNVVQGLELLRTHPIDLVITDANMRPYNGYELLRTIRNDRSFIHLPVVMLTARRDKKDIEKAIAMGINDYIVKPLDPVILIDKINIHLGRAQGMMPEDRSNEIEVNLRAELLMQINIKSLSESGAVITCKHEFGVNTKFRLDSMIFQELGVPAPVVRVLSTVKKDDGFEIRTAYAAMDARNHGRIRAWVAGQQAKRAA